jgi:hypothetical protein
VAIGTIATVAADSDLTVARPRARGMDSPTMGVSVVVVFLVIANLRSEPING